MPVYEHVMMWHRDGDAILVTKTNAFIDAINNTLYWVSDKLECPNARRYSPRSILWGWAQLTEMRVYDFLENRWPGKEISRVPNPSDDLVWQMFPRLRDMYHKPGCPADDFDAGGNCRGEGCEYNSECDWRSWND